MKRVLFALLLTACAEDDPTANDTSTVEVTVSAANQFVPATVRIKVGQKVRWQWAGGTHNVVSGSECGQEDGPLRSGAPVPGGTYEHEFEAAGTFPYYCEPHCSMGMKGEVIVE